VDRKTIDKGAAGANDYSIRGVPASECTSDGAAVQRQSASSRRRLLIVGSHVVQYSSPIFRQIAASTRLDILVAYCSLQGAQSGIDSGFGVEVSWDIPLLDGYPWVHVPNRAPRPEIGRFFGLLNPGLWKIVRDGKYDAVLVSGYFYASAWITILAAKWYGKPILFTTDGHDLRTWTTQSRWKLWFKKFLVRRIFSLGEIVLAGSSGTVEYVRSLGLGRERVVLVRNVVDNAWWTKRAAEVDRDAVRRAWRIPVSAIVVLFCAKMQPWKGPQDLLEAFARAKLENSYLVFAGDGPLRASLEQLAHALGVSERVRILGFVNQSQLPPVYTASDLLVLPSLYESFGFVVNEAMLCGCPVAVSDRVGAKFDIVRQGETGCIFPAGDVDALAAVLRDVLPDTEKRRRMGAAARKRMETWSPREYVNDLEEAVELAARFHRRERKAGPAQD
jgi:glycosyltransferase involved in cell wall biosynthesis